MSQNISIPFSKNQLAFQKSYVRDKMISLYLKEVVLVVKWGDGEAEFKMSFYPGDEVIQFDLENKADTIITNTTIRL
ncbi:hypothetical protein I5677_15440 [Mobilitalea sibirica]|uniref:Uncharacterized protein n=1 Tax=Mobilitalea sibirica TaxID=1462919 RepID=A0A8J7H110_9FIRM|nr:hypothetical protein [Mobilitalea sibirica]MBH1942294.1 hypothetical protein [Mobilitalea sibirica]